MNKARLARHIKGAIRDDATITIFEEENGVRYGNRVIAVVRRLAGGRPIWLARQHPDASGLSDDTLGNRFAGDYEAFVAPQGR